MSFLSPTLRLENLPNHPIMSLDYLPEEKRYNRNNIVAKWCVPINGKMYRIELDHGTSSGRRMIWVNGREVLRRDWMFKLVGEDTFHIEQSRCIIRVDPAPGFKYEYSLYIDGKPHEQYTEELTKQYRLWLTNKPMSDRQCGGNAGDGAVDDAAGAGGADCEYRIMLKLDTLSLYVNDVQCEERAEFVDGGTDTRFNVDGTAFVLQARSSGNKHAGIIHTLLANGKTVPEAKIQEIMHEPVSILTT